MNADGSITITFTGQYAAFDFFLPDNAQNYYSDYKSVVLTYNSRGGNLSHALYDINMQGMDGDASAGKHPDWGQKIKESPNGDTTLVFNVTDECEGGCIRGFQIFNQNQMAVGQSITITVKSLKFYDTINPSIDPTPTDTPDGTATPTLEPGEEGSLVELSQVNEYGKGALGPEGIKYDDNGATFTGLTSNSGGGVIWWARKDCSALNLGDYEKIVFRVTVDHIPEGLGSVPVVLAATKSKDPQFWNVPSIPTYKSITSANTPIELEFSLDSILKGDNPEDRNADIYGIMLKYNAWVKEGETFQGDDVTFTIHSITLVRKES